MRFEDIPILDVGTKIQISGVVYTNESGDAMLMMLPGEELDEGRQPVISGGDLCDRYKMHIVGDMTLENWETFVQQTDRVEVMALVKDEHGQIGKALVRKTARQISQNISWAVYRRDHFRCRYCAADNVPMTVDHLVLWEEGGPSTEANLVTCCKKCNQKRGNTPYNLWMRDPYYKRVSQNLPPMIQDRNEALIPLLDKIERHPLKGKRSRR